MLASRRIAAALAALLLCCASPSLAQVSKSTMQSNTSTAFPDNVIGAITPATTRSYLSGLINSYQQFAGTRNVAGTTDTITAADYGQVILYNSASPVAVTLPQATGSFATFNFYAINLGAGTVTITPSVGTINGASNFAIASGYSVWNVSDGTNWQVWKGFGSGTVNSGAANQIAYYATAGVAVSGAPNTSMSGGALSLGTSGSVVGSIVLFNATTGSVTIQPATGALGSAVATMPAGTYNVVGDSLTQTLSGKVISGANNTLTVRLANDISGFGSGVAAALAIATNGAGGFPTYTATTWTPTVTTSGTVGTPAYSAQVGTYEVIGRQVTVRVTVALSGWTGSPTGNVSIAGLPLTSANVSNDNGVCHFGSYVVNGLTASNVLVGVVQPNTSTILLQQIGNTTSANVSAAQIGTTPTLVGMCNYHT